MLTKRLLPIELSKLLKANEYGITLVSLDEDYRKRMEPRAAPYGERIAALKALHEAGCKTWVSMEPYPAPNQIEQDLLTLLEAVTFVDKIIFGRTNYSKEVSSYIGHKNFYNDCAEKIIDFCGKRNISCHIKQGTLR